MYKLKKQHIIDLATVAAVGTLAAIRSDYWLAAVVACARTADYLLDKRALKKAIKSRTSSDDQNNRIESCFALSDEQGNVIDFLATHYDTLCFGDTNHASPCFNGLITSESLQQRLVDKNAKAFFIEQSLLFQKMIGLLESKKITPQYFAQLISDISRNQKSKSNHILYYELLATAIVKHPGQFRAVDMRDRKAVFPLSAEIIGQVINTAMQMFFPKMLPERLGSLAKLSVSRIIDRKQFLKRLTDDTATASEIAAQVKPGELCSVGFGSGHFTGIAQDYDGIDMVTALKQRGRNPVVINLFSSVTAYKSYKKGLGNKMSKYKYYRTADVDFVFEKRGKIDKIIFNNKNLEDSYRSTAPQHPPQIQTTCLMSAKLV